MEIGVDSFVAATVDAAGRAIDPAKHLSELLEAITVADDVGLDVFGIGEHHRREFLDSAPTVILAAAAARTRRIRLTSAVTVLSAADPVRVFQEFATLDLLSNGRAEIVAGRGSFIEAFPLFGLELEDYDSLFAEKLDLLLNIRANTHVHWSGKHRAPLTGQGVYPRPAQERLPIWLGVGGTPPPRDPGAFWQAPFRGPTFRGGRRPRAAGARRTLRAKRPLTDVAKMADDAGGLAGCVVPADRRQHDFHRTAGDRGGAPSGCHLGRMGDRHLYAGDHLAADDVRAIG